MGVIITSLNSFVVSLGMLFFLSTGTDPNPVFTLEQVPYEVDSSNQAAWWSPLALYGTEREYAYMAYCAPGSTSGYHTINFARRDYAGRWTEFKCQNADGTVPEYVNDSGHNQPSIARDGSGYWHIFGSMHNDLWHYFRSDTVGGAPVFHSADMPDQQARITYPILATAPNGDLYLFVRDGNVIGKKIGVLYRWNNAVRVWIRVATIASEEKRACYPDDLTVDPEGNVHILYEWFSVNSSSTLAGQIRHRLSYLMYNPQSNVFYNAAGDVVTVPRSSEDSDWVQPFGGGEDFDLQDLYDDGEIGVQVGALAVDSDNRPVVAYRYRSVVNGNFEIWYASYSSGWERQLVYNGFPTTATVGVTWSSVNNQRVYYCVDSGTNRVFMARKNPVWNSVSIAPGKAVSRVVAKWNGVGSDILYLMDVYNRTLYYGRN